MCYLKYYYFLSFFFFLCLLSAFLLRKSKCVFQLIGPSFRDLVLGVDEKIADCSMLLLCMSANKMPT